MLFDNPFLVDWTKIGEYKQKQPDNNTKREISASVDWDYQPGNTVLLCKDVSFAKLKASMKMILGP